MGLKLVADETKLVLPSILSKVPSKFDAEWATLETMYHQDGSTLPKERCPGVRKPCIIEVLNMDSFDAAVQLEPNHTVRQHCSMEKTDMDAEDEKPAIAPKSGIDTPIKDVATSEDAQGTLQDPEVKKQPGKAKESMRVRPVAVLNLASERSPGGGWQKGALAQEECLCYRSSLYLTLDREQYYPIPALAAIYSPNVVIIRNSMPDGHELLDSIHPMDLPALSVISVAALRQPPLSDDGKTFKNIGARAHTKNNVRLILRVAARHGHTKLVLGALGCGVYSNPPGEVARCFLEVLHEPEFQGGWFEKVVFAVLDNVRGPDGGKDGTGNFGVFYRVLHGQVV
ncbi:hypothetical protein J4E91_001328 [Alternaria rosae]|nr:hypothetical protein J4E91_001328 [Alternaria rosae]